MGGFGPVPADKAQSGGQDGMWSGAQPGPQGGAQSGVQGGAQSGVQAGGPGDGRPRKPVKPVKTGRGRRRGLLVGGAVIAVLMAAGALGFVLFKPSGEDHSATSSGPTAGPTAIALGGKPGSGSARGKVDQLLPRARKVSGLKAMTAPCRDASYRPKGQGAEVTVGFNGQGVIAVAVYTRPAAATGPLTQVHTMAPADPRHTFQFPRVPGKLDHVRISLTAPAGVDQCYARKA